MGHATVDTLTVRATGNRAVSNIATVTVEVLPPVAGATTQTVLIASLENATLRKQRGKAIAVGARRSWVPRTW
jgi:hypothetical protein